MMFCSTRIRCCPHLLLFPKFKLKSFTSSSISSSNSPQYRQWSGLEQWRESPINPDRAWGPKGPKPPLELHQVDLANGSGSSLAELGALVLSTSDPLAKSQLSHFAYSKLRSENLPIGVSDPPAWPARPSKPELVSPKDIPAPKDSGLPLNAYMLHNLAHVELNAIDLAWDTVVRFSPYKDLLGEGFFADFAHVADDESRHFSWCSQRLAELGFSYGDMPAHNLLWRECEKSSDNVAARLAAIPLVQVFCFSAQESRLRKLQKVGFFCCLESGHIEEARGLDAGPRLVKKLVGCGDNRTSKIVAKIADEEVAHVAVGVYWFISICQKMGRVPCSTFKDILREYDVEVKGPFNYSAREVAGLPRHWYDDQEKEQLSEAYERLAHIIAMENENASSSRPPE